MCTFQDIGLLSIIDENLFIDYQKIYMEQNV